MSEDFQLALGRASRIAVFRVEPDRDLLQALVRIAERSGIRTGLIISAVGSLKRARLRNMKYFPRELPVRDEHRSFVDVDGPLEILSLSGNLLREEGGGIAVHAHIAVSKVDDGGIKVFGGHLVEGNITYLMVEIAIAEVEDVDIVRAVHPERKGLELTVRRPQWGIPPYV